MRQVDQLLDEMARHGAGLPFCFAALFEYDERRNATYGETRRDGRIPVGIDFGDQHFSLMFVREFIDDGRHRLTWCAPIGVEIHDSRDRRVSNHPFKIVVAQAQRAVEKNWTAALATFGAVGDAHEIDAIQCAAEGTRDGRGNGHTDMSTGAHPLAQAPRRTRNLARDMLPWPAVGARSLKHSEGGG